METHGITVQVVTDAAAIVGGIPKLANMLGVRRQTFYQWKKVPPGRVLALEAATGGLIPRQKIRPDLYPNQTGAAA